MDLARLQTPPLHQTCLQKSDLHRVRHNPAAARQLANPLMVNSGKREMNKMRPPPHHYQLEGTQFGSPTQRCTKSKCRKAQLAASNSALHFSLFFQHSGAVCADFSNTALQFALSFSQKCISRLVLHFLKTTECKNAYLGVFKSLQTS